MRKRVKYGLVAGVVAAGIVTFLMSSGPGPLPTLPTPPGVVVPEGMRYVGGDEFDAPDGSAPDATKWIRGVLGGNVATATIEHGCLVIRGKDKDSLQILTLQQKFHRGRVEVGVRFPQPGRMSSAHVSFGQSVPPYSDFEIVGMSYLNGSLIQSIARRGRSISIVPAEFTHYTMVWDARGMAVSKSNGPESPVYYQDEKPASKMFSDNWNQPWKIIGDWNRDRKGKSALMDQLADNLSFLIFYKGADDLEIDYVRIFQE